MMSARSGRSARSQGDAQGQDVRERVHERAGEPLRQAAEHGSLVQQVLTLDGLGIRKVVDAPPGVEVLSVSDNRLKALGAISSCSSLRELNLAGNRFQEAALVPLARLSHLHALDISRNQVRSLEPLFPDFATEFGSGAFPRLEVLDISENMALTDVQPALAARHLRVLRANGIAAIDLSCRPTSTLEVLEMGSCSLATVENLLALCSLRELVLDGNALLACAAVLSHPRLETLRLAKNAVARAPPPQLPSLTTLDLAANQLVELPVFGGARNITSLSLRENDLTSLGPLATLRHLTFLDASCNHLQELDASLALGALKPLRALVLSSNDFERAEDVLAVLARTERPALEHLDLRDNPFSFAFYPEGAQQLPAWTWDAEASLETGGAGMQLLDTGTRRSLEQYRAACAVACPALQSLDGMLVSARERLQSSMSPQSVQTASQMCVSEVQTQQSWFENDGRLVTSGSAASRSNQDPEEVVYGTPYPISENAEGRVQPALGQVLPAWPPPSMPDVNVVPGTQATWAEVVASISALRDSRRSGAAASTVAEMPPAASALTDPAVSPVLDGSPLVNRGRSPAAMTRSESAERIRSRSGSPLPMGPGPAFQTQSQESSRARLEAYAHSPDEEQMPAVPVAQSARLAAPLLGSPHEPAPTEALPRARGSNAADPFNAPSLWRRQFSELPPSPARSARTPSMSSKAPREVLRTNSELPPKAADGLGGASARSAYLRFLEDEIIAQRAFLRMHRGGRQDEATPRRHGLFARSAEDVGAAAFGARRHREHLAWGMQGPASASLERNVEEHVPRSFRNAGRLRNLVISQEEEQQEPASGDDDEDEESSESDEGVTFSFARGCVTRRRAAMPSSQGSKPSASNIVSRSAAGCRQLGRRYTEQRRDDLRWDSAHGEMSARPPGQIDLDEALASDADEGYNSSYEAPSTAASGSVKRHSVKLPEPSAASQTVVTGPLLFNGALSGSSDLGSVPLGDTGPSATLDFERGVAGSAYNADLDRVARLAAGLDEVREFSRRTPAVPSALLRDVKIVQTEGPEFGDDPYNFSMTARKQNLFAPAWAKHDESVSMLGSGDETWKAIVTAASAEARQLLEELLAQQAWRVPGRPVLYRYALGRAVQTETTGARRCFKTLSVRDVARAGAAPPRLSPQQRAFFCGDAQQLAEVISSPFGFSPVFEGMVLLFALDLRHAEALSASCDWAPCNCGAGAPPRLLGRALVAELALGRCHTAVRSLQDAILPSSAALMSKNSSGAASGAVPMSPVFEAAYRDGADSVYFPQSGVIAILNPMRALPLFLAEYRRERVTVTERARLG